MLFQNWQGILEQETIEEILKEKLETSENLKSIFVSK